MNSITHPKWTLLYLPLLAHLHSWIGRFYSFSSTTIAKFHYSQIRLCSSHSSKIIMSSSTLSQSSFTYFPPMHFFFISFQKRLIFCHPLNSYKTVLYHLFNLDSLLLLFFPSLFCLLFSPFSSFIPPFYSLSLSLFLLFSISISLLLFAFISLFLILAVFVFITIKFDFGFGFPKFFFEFRLPIFYAILIKVFWDVPLPLWFLVVTVITFSLALILWFFILKFLAYHIRWGYL